MQVVMGRLICTQSIIKVLKSLLTCPFYTLRSTVRPSGPLAPAAGQLMPACHRNLAPWHSLSDGPAIFREHAIIKAREEKDGICKASENACVFGQLVEEAYEYTLLTRGHASDCGGTDGYRVAPAIVVRDFFIHPRAEKADSQPYGSDPCEEQPEVVQHVRSAERRTVAHLRHF